MLKMKASKYLPIKRHDTNPELFGQSVTAIYFLLLQNRIVYIGKTTNLTKRICGHKSSLFRSKWFDSFRYIECGLSDLDRYERRWIGKFNPLHNRIHCSDGRKPFKSIRKIQRIEEEGKVYIQRTA